MCVQPPQNLDVLSVTQINRATRLEVDPEGMTGSPNQYRSSSMTWRAPQSSGTHKALGPFCLGTTRIADWISKWFEDMRNQNYIFVNLEEINAVFLAHLSLWAKSHTCNQEHTQEHMLIPTHRGPGNLERWCGKGKVTSGSLERLQGDRILRDVQSEKKAFREEWMVHEVGLRQKKWGEGH